MRLRGIVCFLVLLCMAFVGCSRKKRSMPFWFLLGTGGAVSDASGTGLGTPPDSNGVPLPTPNDSVSPTDPGGVPGNNGQQEVPTKGPGRIIGTIVPVVSGVPSNDICGRPGAPLPPSCVDLSQIVVRIEVANGNGSSVVSEVYANPDGSFEFLINDLPNNNYRVLINDGFGLNYAYQDFSFVFNPTQVGYTTVDVGNLFAERRFYTAGPTEFSGIVTTPGYNNGGVVVPSGPVAGVLVEVRDQEGNVVGSDTTDGNGSFQIVINPLPNGNYTVVYIGADVVVSGQPFGTVTDSIHVTFPGTNPNQTSQINLGDTSIPWLASTISDVLVSGSILNGAIPSDSSTLFTIKLKNQQGAIISSVTITGNGSFQIEGSDLHNGVYTIEVSSPLFFTVSQPFLFTAAADGGQRQISLPNPIAIVAKPSQVVGFVQDQNGNHVNGAVINFKPSNVQAPSRILYLKEDPLLGNAVKLWILEAMSAVAGQNCALNPTGAICACAVNPTAACLIANQGTGPYSYQTYGNKLYDVNPSTSEVSFLAASGVWAYYISAPGFKNYCGSNAEPCSANPLSVTLNGSSFNAGTVGMTSITGRSQIAGTISVRDNAPTVNSTHTNQTGLFVVLLGNTGPGGSNLAHITTTTGGSFAFNGNSYVVTIPTTLPAQFTNDDSGRVAYALYSLGSGNATLLSQATTIAKQNDSAASIDVINGTEYNFKQSSYQLIVVDRVAPSHQGSYLSPSSLRVDTSATASNLYATNPITFQVAGTVVHSPRALVTGTVTDAISTGVVSGANITLGRLVGGNFTADIRRDCFGSFDSPNCSVPSLRVAGQDQVVGTVVSSSNGSYSFPFLSPGSYQLRIEKNGITTYFPVEVGSGGGTVTVNTPIITNNGRGHLSGSVRTPGGFAFTGTYSLEIVDPNGGTIRPTAGVMPASIQSGATIFSNAPQYTIFNINAGRWKVRFVSAGFKSVEGIVDIQADVTTNFDIITFVPGTQTNGTISGRALSALYNTGVCDLTARIRPGVNVKSGPYAIDINGATIPAVTTATDGSYAIPSVPPGNYTLEVSGSGKRGNCTSSVEAYATTYRTVVAAGSETPANQNILVSPILGSNEMRIVLTWGAKPKDLDSHLQYGTSSGDRIVWNRRTPLGPGNGNLDYDVVTGFGPETITLQGTIWNQPNRYYSIYNWSNEALMGVSGANVRVFKGSVGEVRNYSVGAGHSNRWWKIFCIEQDQTIKDVGTAGCNASNFLERSKY